MLLTEDQCTEKPSDSYKLAKLSFVWYSNLNHALQKGDKNIVMIHDIKHVIT